LLRTARARVAVSRFAKAVFEAQGSGPCHVVYSAVAPASELAARRAVAWKEGRVRILLPGRLQAEKGQRTAVEAMRVLVDAGHDVELRIVGDGDAGPCEEAIERCGLRDVVTMVGFVLDLDTEYRRAHIALSCSRIEAMGRTTVEAMSYGLPVVACGSMGTRELIEDGVNGLLCDGSPAAFAAAIGSLLERPDAARRLGERARADVQSHFSEEACVRKALSVLDGVSDERPRFASQRGDATEGDAVPTSER
jgi:glycosyltransferase involved in cell wall biosynthesis